MDLILVAHNLRSAHNCGALLRTADCLGAKSVYFTGYSPYPKQKNDARLPHIAQRVHKNITKTALGAELSVDWQHFAAIKTAISKLKNEGYQVIALEQHKTAQSIVGFEPTSKLAIIVGNEVTGLSDEELVLSDTVIEIPMKGEKESLNVVQASAIALYHCLYQS